MKSYEKVEQYDTEITEALAGNYKTIIDTLGEDVNREDVVTIRVSTEELKEIKVKDFMKLLK